MMDVKRRWEAVDGPGRAVEAVLRQASRAREWTGLPASRAAVGHPDMSTPIRRLDHVAIAVCDTEVALGHFSGRLGLEVVHSEELDEPHVLLTYLDAGNVFIQLVEPLGDETSLARFLDERGEGIHHICFAVDDVLQGAQALSVDGDHPVAGRGRGRAAAFVPGPALHGVRIECTEFDHRSDVLAARGWLDRTPTR